jgi:hypothetical protein
MEGRIVVKLAPKWREMQSGGWCEGVVRVARCLRTCSPVLPVNFDLGTALGIASSPAAQVSCF